MTPISLTTLIRPPATFSHPMGEGIFYGMLTRRSRCALTPGYFHLPRRGNPRHPRNPRLKMARQSLAPPSAVYFRNRKRLLLVVVGTVAAMPVALVTRTQGALLQNVSDAPDCSSRKSCANNGQETVTLPVDGVMFNCGRGAAS